MALRVPRGVTVDGEGVGGRFVSPADLPGLGAASDEAGVLALVELAARELDRASAAELRVERKFQNDPKRYAVARADAEAVREFWDSTLEQLLSLLEGEEEYEDSADEWEIGFDYDAAGGGSSDVDINIRIRRNDGADMPFSEAVRALGGFRDRLGAGMDNPIPDGYQMASINWRRPRSAGGWRPRGGSGTRQDLENFNSVLYVASGDDAAWTLTASGLRIGSVKRGSV